MANVNQETKLFLPQTNTDKGETKSKSHLEQSHKAHKEKTILWGEIQDMGIFYVQRLRPVSVRAGLWRIDDVKHKKSSQIWLLKLNILWNVANGRIMTMRPNGR